MAAIVSDICADFLVEVGEILEQLGEQMVLLERMPHDRDCLNAVFRGFHTIKGGAGFLDFTTMVTICHAVEDRFDAARTGAAPLDEHAFDAAQQSLDLLIDMLHCISEGLPPQPPPAAVLAALRSGTGTTAPPPVAVIDPAIAAFAAGGDDIDDMDFEALLDSLHVRRLDALVNLVGELVLARNRMKTIRPRLRDDELDHAVAALDAATSRLQSAVMSARMQPVGRVFARFPKLARDVARQLQKKVDLEVVGADTELDRNLVEALADPLLHLVRNAIDHGIELPEVRRRAGKPEAGCVRLSAQQEGDHVAIEVRDDGAGIDPETIRGIAIGKGLIDAEAAARLSADECLQLLFLPGFSTRDQVSDLSGRGVGMDVVQSRIRELSGVVQIHSEPGAGSRFVIRVPLTLAILPTLLVEIDDDVYALPMARVVEVLAHEPGDALWIDGQQVLDLRQQPLPLLGLRDWLGLESTSPSVSTAVVLQSGESRFCLTVDCVRGREEVVIKALPPTLRGLPGYAGASLVGDGRMALILDVDALLRTGLRGSAPPASAFK